MVIAVDFDGTLCGNEYPEIGPPNLELIKALIEAQKIRGHYIILWTCRRDEMLRKALDFCSEYGLEFDGVNNRPAAAPDIYATPAGTSKYRKVFADIYIDDRALSPSQFCISLKEFSKNP